MSKFMGGLASFFVVVFGLGLIFSEGAALGCFTLLGLLGIWAYIQVSDRQRDAVEEVIRLRDVLEEIEEGVQLPPGYTGDPVDYYRALARLALQRDGRVDLSGEEAAEEVGRREVAQGR